LGVVERELVEFPEQVGAVGLALQLPNERLQRERLRLELATDGWVGLPTYHVDDLQAQLDDGSDLLVVAAIDTQQHRTELLDHL